MELKDFIHLYKDSKIIHEKYPDTEMTVHHFSKAGQITIGRSDEFMDLKPYHKLCLRPLSDWSLRESSEYGVSMESMRSVIELGIYEPKLFRYLLSKGFDLFGLIESGLAIDKTKKQ